MTDRRTAQAATEGQPETPTLSEASAGYGGAPAEAPTVGADASSPAAARPPSLGDFDRLIIKRAAAIDPADVGFLPESFIGMLEDGCRPNTLDILAALAREAEGRLAAQETTDPALVAAIQDRHRRPA